MIDWTLLRSKFGPDKAAQKFEDLAFLYVKDIYPDFVWLPTPPKGDGNRDARVALDGEYEIWEEAKYRNSVRGPTHKKDRNLEKKDIDSTILSGLIYGKVRLIIFVSNAKMPSEVMSRAMLGAKIRGIEVTCALAAQLESWLAQHKPIYETIFESPFPEGNLPSPIRDFQKARFYDLFSTDFSPLQQKKGFYTGEICALGLVVYTSEPVTVRLKPLEVPFCVLEHPDFNGLDPIDLPAGLSNLIFLVQMAKQQTGGVNICLEIDGNPFYRISNQITVFTESCYRISYGRQFEIISQIQQLLLNPNLFHQGMLITLYADSSMGKSYVLRQLFKEFSLKYDISIIEFDSNKNSQANYSLLCKIVLFLFYGNIFWDMAADKPEEVRAFKSQVLDANTAELFDNEILSQIIDGCFDANIACGVIQTLSKRSKQEGLPIVGSRRTKFPRILLLDDFQYLYGPQETFVKLLLQQLTVYHNSNVLVISATRGKFESNDLESYFLHLTPNHFTLDGLTWVDKNETICTAFQIPPASLDSVVDQILPDSPLLTGEVLRIIGSHLSSNPNPLSIILAYTTQVDSPQLLQDKFQGFDSQFYLLDIIYKFKKGIPISLIENYPSFVKAHLEEDIKSLLGQNLIAVRNNMLVPYHEYYISAYQQLRGENMYSSEVGLFLEYLLAQSSRSKVMDVNQILTMLLWCGPQYAKIYKKQVKKFMLKYIHGTQFGAALHFCEYYYEQIAPIGKRKLTHEESYLLYLYADCLVHCDHMGRAHEKLAEVYQYAQDDSLEKYEAGASLLNQYFWEVQPEKVIADSFLIQRGLECLPKTLLRGENKRRIVRSHESCFNRRMAAYLLIDQVEPAHEIYLDRLKAFVSYDRKTFPSHSATIIMDYARGLSFFAPEESRRLMYIALKFFKSEAKLHYRRILLCGIDVGVLDSIVEKQYRSQMFHNLKAQLLKSGFLSEYFKAVMKHAACKLIDYASATKGSALFPPNAQIFRDFETELQECLLVTQLRPNGRELLLMNYIKAFISARRREMDQAKGLLKACISIIQAAGKSYQIALNHNLTHLEHIETISWYTSQVELRSNVFFIDCRFW